ncbi:MAG TPA: hypothetical protein DDY68_01280 [Porphyromonadaceae bacterium]|nr:hypothetical protein [Porphyromonadaceae bacterium]
MKRIVTLLSLALGMIFSSSAQQAAMPTIIVFPDDAWMNENGFMTTINNNGETEYLPRYNDAFVQNSEIGTAIQSVQKVLEERGFQHEDLQNLLKDMKRERAEELANLADGDASEKGAMDELLQQAKPDIRIDLHYTAKEVGPRKNISFRLKAVDAYCNDQISSCEGTVEMTLDPLDLALRKVIAGKMDEFCAQIMNYFQDLHDNGRKITVVFRTAEGSGINFLRDEIKKDGDTYNDFLYDWVKDHAINKSAKKGRQTKNLCEFKNVRIPFFDDHKEPIEPEDWARSVRKDFRKETGIKVAKGQGNTLGRVNFLVGVE